MKPLRLILIALLIIGPMGCGSFRDIFTPAPKSSGKGGSNKTYIVREGDTLSEIASRFRSSYQYLAEYNNIEDPSEIRVGQKIYIPVRGKNARKDGKKSKDGIHTDHSLLAWPVDGKLSSRFGDRGNGRDHHDGIDISAPRGTQIVAADSGEVVYCNRMGGYGNLIIVKHKNGYFTAYAHLDKISVQKGDRVMRGKTEIGRVGTTGNASGAHLHFEVRRNELPRNPLFYLPKRERLD